MKRLGGTGLTRRETTALAAYLEGLPAVRAPTRDLAQVARDKQLFETERLPELPRRPGVHPPAPQASGNAAEKLEGRRAPIVVVGALAATPTKLGVPILLRDRGAVHGMADTAQLTDPQVRDLTAFLETL
jgi:hypothetical protein